jgi:Rieske Fe-S protein
MDRRAFVARAGGLALVGACASLPLAACAGARYVPAQWRDGRVVLRLADFGAEEGVLVEHPSAGRPVYVHRFAPDRFGALFTRCTHRGCQVEPQGLRLVCPCHGSTFSLDGSVLEGPAERALTAYPVTLEGDHVVVDLREGGSR